MMDVFCRKSCTPNMAQELDKLKEDPRKVEQLQAQLK
jgi:hypothetical protein